MSLSASLLNKWRFFTLFQGLRGPILAALEKRDSRADSAPSSGRIFGCRRGGKWQAAADLLEKGGAAACRRCPPSISDPGLALHCPRLHPKYRPDVDGLRAIAVMLVLNFHAFPDAMPGGFIGVDVFFVISGFLITGIITRELELGRFSLVDFYNRRIRRIFPALIVVLCSDIGAGLVLDAAGGLCAARQRQLSPARRFWPISRCCCSPAISTSNPPKSRCCICGRSASRNSFICSGRCS